MDSTNYFKLHIKEPKSEDRYWFFNNETLEQQYAAALAGSYGRRLCVYKRPAGVRFQLIPEVGEVFSPTLIMDLCNRARASEDHAEKYLNGRPFEAKDGQELAAMSKVFQSMSESLKEMGTDSYVRTDQPRMKPPPSAAKAKNL